MCPNTLKPLSASAFADISFCSSHPHMKIADTSGYYPLAFSPLYNITVIKKKKSFAKQSHAFISYI